MITIPLWSFISLCGVAGLGALGWVAAVVRAERTVGRILAEELAPPPIWDREPADGERGRP